jgi:arylsulfatase A-like enzyme
MPRTSFIAQGVRLSLNLVLLGAVLLGACKTFGAEDRPINLLFLMTDQHHFAALGCAGNSVVKTPNLDRLAAQGARLSNAFCVTPYCSPTRAAIVTGRFPSSYGLGRNIAIGPRCTTDELRLHEPCETYLHQLAARGYHCHQLGKWHLGRPSQLSCFPEGDQDDEFPKQLTERRVREAGAAGVQEDAMRSGEVERAGDEETGAVYMRSEIAKTHRDLLQQQTGPAKNKDHTIIGRAVRKPELWPESVLADYCIDLLRRHRHEPFAITYSVSPPHAPFIAPSPFYDQYAPQQFPLPTTWNDRPQQFQKSSASRTGAAYGEAGFREYLRCYYARVAMMDWCIGRILDALDELGLSDRTLVVFTSDHGNMLGQHGMMEKSTLAFYDDLMRVPLLMRLPGSIAAGTVCEAGASSVDLAPTILDYLAAPPLKSVHGRSLRPFLDGQPDDGRPIYGERGEPNVAGTLRMIRTRDWKLCLPAQESKNVVTDLYQLDADPGETRNLARDASARATLRDLTTGLLEHMNSIGDHAYPRYKDRQP